MPEQARRPVGRPRADGRPPITREAVFEAAARLIAIHGYAGTSLRMIAAELGASAPSISQMFGAKQQLLVDLVQTMASVSVDFHEQLAALALQPDVRLYKMVYEEVLAVSSANESMMSVFYLPELRQPGFEKAQASREAMLRFYRDTLAEGTKTGTFRDISVALVAEQVFQLTETAIVASNPGELGDSASLAEETAELVLCGILARPSRVSAVANAARKIPLQMLALP